MNAPKKLYLYPYSTDGIYEVETKPLEGTIEYTRTDAFLAKARKWFEKQNEWRDINGNRHCDLNDFEDFRNYMKEVKEVDLEKECSKYFEENDDLCVHDDYIKFARHFFELGMAVSGKA